LLFSAQSEDPAISFAEISQELWAATNVLDTMRRIVDLSVATIERCDAAALSVLEGNEVVTPVWTKAEALEMEKLQRRLGEGPGLDALLHKRNIYAEDLSVDPRWTKFGPFAATSGIRCLLSLRIGSGDAMAALNLYSADVRAYEDYQQTRARIFATHARVALEARKELEKATQALEAKTSHLKQLRAALVSRDIIGQAKGVLMERERITSDRALHKLRLASQRLNVKLRDVAQRVVDTGETPEPGP
jgi:hypothetical protein